MIGEIIPEIYDVKGRAVSAPYSRKRRRLFHATFPIKRYLSQSLSVKCSNMKELREFLDECSYVSDMEQFNMKDYWMPPEDFEKSRKGDCEDFALWTWRQLMGMGYKARFVVGRAGKYGEGHAWVTMEKDGKQFLVEALASEFGDTLPRLSVVRYEPEGSVEWDGKNVHYYMHEKRRFTLPVHKIPILVIEWLLFWLPIWILSFIYLLLLPYFFIKKLIKRYLFQSK